MRFSLMISGVAFFAFTMTACAVDVDSETADQQALETKDTPTINTEDIATPVELSLNRVAPRACFIEGFCVSGHTEFCIHTGPCAPGQAIGLASLFCNSHGCSSNCGPNNILQRPNCP